LHAAIARPYHHLRDVELSSVLQGIPMIYKDGYVHSNWRSL